MDWALIKTISVNYVCNTFGSNLITVLSVLSVLSLTGTFQGIMGAAISELSLLKGTISLTHLLNGHIERII